MKNVIEVIEFEGKKFDVIARPKDNCSGCYFQDKICFEPELNCQGWIREDGKDVNFQEHIEVETEMQEATTTQEPKYLSKEEVAVALFEGKRLINSSNGMPYWIDLNNVELIYGNNIQSILNLTEVLTVGQWIHEDKPWYLDIPKTGKLCYVWDDTESNKHVTVITYYDEKAKDKFRAKFVSWHNAVPLTNEEIKSFLTRE